MKKVLILLIGLWMLSACIPASKENCMAIEGASTGQIVDFGQVAGVQGATVMSLLLTINLDSLTSIEAGNIAVIANNYDVNHIYGWNLFTFNSSTIWEFFARSGGGTPGEWAIASPGIGAIKHVALTYDGSSAANDPIFYVNGASVALTIDANGSAPMLNTDTEFSILNRNDTGISKTQTMDGKLYQVLLYNRILSAQEILDAYNSKQYIPTLNGLVFAPNLLGAAGNKNDGDALAAGNTIADMISGALGVPAGSPVLREDNYLTCENIF